MKEQSTNSVSKKTPTTKAANSYGHKIVSKGQEVDDPLDQERQLKECMENSQTEASVSMVKKDGLQSGINASLGGGELTLSVQNKMQEVDFHKQGSAEMSPIVIDNYVDTGFLDGAGMDDWVTPECILANLSEC